MRRRLASFAYALAGLAHMVAREANARIHLVVTVFAIAASVYLDLSAADWRWILAMIALVWFAEIVNTAFETLADTLHPDHHPGIGLAKDLAAAAVLVAAILAAVVGILTFWPYVAAH